MSRLRRYSIALSAASLGTFLAIVSTFWAAAATPANLALELADPRAADAEPAFVDAMKQAAPWTSTRSLALDRDGNVLRLAPGQTAQTVVFAGGRYPAGDYVLSFRGTGRIGVDGASVTARSSGRLVLRATPRPGGIRLRLEATAPGDPVRNLRLTLPGYAQAAASPYLPSFVTALRGYAALRFGSWQLGRGLGIEDEVALANATGVRPWFVLPGNATDADVAAFARTVHAELSPRLRPLVEWNSASAHLTPAAAFARSERVAAIVDAAFGSPAGRVERVLDAAQADELGTSAGRIFAGRFDGVAADAERAGPSAPAVASARSLGATVFAYRRAAAAGQVPAAAPATSATFNAWSMYGYDPAHNGYNPNSRAFTPASLASLHLGWTANANESNTQTQPVLITNSAGTDGTLVVGGGSGNVVAFDALSGSRLWTKTTGEEALTCGGGTFDIGISGSAVYAPRLGVAFVVNTQNASVNGPSTVTLHKFNPATGVDVASVSVLPAPLAGEIDTAHTSLTLDRTLNLVYVGVGSTCDISSWRGSVTAINTVTMKVVNRFYTTFGRGGQYSGGGVWAWGGVTLDAAGNVYFGVGNADDSGKDQSPFVNATTEHVGYSEHLVATNANLSSVIASNYPGFGGPNQSVDLDFTGSPTVFTPVGCPQLLGLQGKAGQLIFYGTASIASGPIASFQLSESSYNAAFLGNPGYSPNTGLVYAAVPSALGGSIEEPGMVAIDTATCAPAVAWNAVFGPDSYSLSDFAPRTAPTVTAGGVVFLGAPASSGSGGSLWAIDASSGAILNGGQPVLNTAGRLRMAPIVSNNWLWVLDNDGDLYGLTLDPDVPAVANRTRAARHSRAFGPPGPV